MASQYPDLERAIPTFLGGVLVELKQLHQLAVPKVLTNLVFYIQSFVSVYLMGMLGGKELAAGSFAIGFANIFGYSILTGLAQGIESICGQSYGGARFSHLGLTLQRMVIIIVGCSVLLCILWANMTRLLVSFNSLDVDMLNAAQIYLNYLLPDLFAQSLLLPLEVYLRSQQLTKPVMCTSILSVVLHIPTILILVNWFDMGIRGVALATSVTDLMHIVLLSIYLYWSGICQHSWVRPSWKAFKELGQMLKLAVSSCVAVAIEWWWYEIILIAAGFLPDAEASVASMGILIRFTALTYTFPSALAAAVSTRVGNELGANEAGNARKASLVAMVYSFVWALIACSFAISVRKEWGPWFTQDSATLSLISMALPVVGLCELANYPQTVAYGILMGSSRPNVSVIVYSIAFYFVGLPTAMILGFYLQVGLLGFWYSLLAAQFTCAALMLFVVLGTSWREEAQRAQARLLSSSGRGETASLLQ